ncbi:hypothetical protein D918_09919 [Trichuris suis]|nr:hypothetical protein D918_09919 [Trichuris suis]
MDYGLFNNAQPSELTDIRSIPVLTATGNETKIAGTSHAFWTLQRTCDVLTTHGRTTGWTAMENVPGIFR